MANETKRTAARQELERARNDARECAIQRDDYRAKWRASEKAYQEELGAHSMTKVNVEDLMDKLAASVSECARLKAALAFTQGELHRWACTRTECCKPCVEADAAIASTAPTPDLIGALKTMKEALRWYEGQSVIRRPYTGERNDSEDSDVNIISGLNRVEARTFRRARESLAAAPVLREMGVE